MLTLIDAQLGSVYYSIVWDHPAIQTMPDKPLSSSGAEDNRGPTEHVE